MPPGHHLTITPLQESRSHPDTHTHEQNALATISRTPTHRGSRGSVSSNPQTAQTDLTTPDPLPDALLKDESKSSSTPNLARPDEEVALAAGDKSFSLPEIHASEASDNAATNHAGVEHSTHSNTTREQEQHQGHEEAVVENLPSDPSPHLDFVLQSLGNVVHLRDELFLAHSSLEQEREKLLAARRFLEDSQGDLMDTCQRLLAEGNTEAMQLTVPEIFNRVRSDFDTHKAQSERVRALESDFRNKEFTLLDVDRELNDYIRHAFPQIPPPPPPLPDGIIPMDLIGHALSPSPTTPGPLNAYWDAIGQRDALTDELYDLDAEHQYEQAEMDAMLEHEGPPPDEIREFEREFEYKREHFEQKREQLSQEINDADARVEELRNACLSLGINPDIPRKAPSLSSSPSLHPHPDREPQNEGTDFNQPDAAAKSEPFLSRPLSEFQLEAPLQASLSSDNLHTSTNERIETWLFTQPDDAEALQMAPTKSPAYRSRRLVLSPSTGTGSLADRSKASAPIPSTERTYDPAAF